VRAVPAPVAEETPAREADSAVAAVREAESEVAGSEVAAWEAAALEEENLYPRGYSPAAAA
jgi:hypothetical protein